MAKDRSPNYPAISLAEAITLVKALWDKEKRTAVRGEVVAGALGYKSLSGPVRTRLAAMKKYGLVEGDFSALKVSELAIRVLHSPEGSPEQLKAMQEAALRPELIKELASTHADASDDALRSHLLVAKKFTEEGARQFIRSFRDTLALAKLKGAVYTEDENKTETEAMDEIRGLEQRKRAKIDQLLRDLPSHYHNGKSYPIPLKKQNEATLTFKTFPLEKADLLKIKQWIDLMADNLTETHEEQQTQ